MNFRDPKIILALSLMLILFGIIFGFVAFPFLLRSIIKSQAHLLPGSAVRAMYEKPPFYFNFFIYIFNVTNKDDVIKGKKPKLEEIGPYFFEEWKEKFDITDDEEEDTVTFHSKNTYIFRPDLSGNLTGDEIIVVPHPLIVGLFLATNYDKKPMLGAVENAVNSLFHNPADAFFTGRVMDLLYDGVSIDCSPSDDRFAGAACMQLADQEAIKKIDENHLKFSMFGGMNGTDIGEFTTLRGKKNYRDLGRLIKYNGALESDAWEEDECNEFKGTETTIIPPLISPSDVIWAYDPAICRSMGTTYANIKTKLNGIPVYVFELDIGHEVNTKQCFCRDEDTCPARGSFDVYRCTGLPVYVTLPHFYKAEQLLSGIESGLVPNKTFHDLFLNLEVLTGVPISFAKRVQLNLDMKPIPQIAIMKNMPDIYFPVFWFEESLHLPKDLTDQLKAMYWFIYVIIFLKWLCIGIGAFGFLGTGATIIISGESFY